MQDVELTNLLTLGCQVSLAATPTSHLSLTKFASLARLHGGLLIIRDASQLSTISLTSN